ncbi:hypothetical protein Tco_1233139 [Tanacetum coccineum]
MISNKFSFIINPEEDDVELDDLDFGDIPDIEGVDVPQFVRPSMSTGTPLTQEEDEREALAISIYERYSILEEERPVGVTTIIAKFLVLEMLIDRDTPILVERGFLHTCGGILNKIDNITSTFDGICHQTFRAAKTSLDTAKSDSDDEEEYEF